MTQNDKNDITQQEKTCFEEKKGINIIKYAMLGIGTISFVFGLIRQWPIVKKGICGVH